MNLKYLICFPLLIFLTCNESEKTISNEALVYSVNKYTYQYHQSGNTKYLDSAYSLLKRNKDYRTKGLSYRNSQTVIALLLNLQKYSELEILLKSDTLMDPYDKFKVLNLTRYLEIAKKDRIKANEFIRNNILMITDSLRRNPKDSILYADYFSMRMFLVGKDKVLSEIDSMMRINNEFSPLFYEKILKESIKNYPDRMLP